MSRISSFSHPRLSLHVDLGSTRTWHHSKMASYHQRRDSTCSEASIQLPQGPRASVTTASITTQDIDAVRGSFAAPRSPERATDILSKVFLAPALLSAIGQKAPEMLRHHILGGAPRERPTTADSQSTTEMEESRSSMPLPCAFPLL